MMKKNLVRSLSVISVIVLLTLLYSSCAKDGAMGPAGADGVGTNGTNGANGATGANGLNGSDGANGYNGAMGATGSTGATGANGMNGVDAVQTCKQCHTATVVEQRDKEYALSKHSYGDANFEEAGNASCAPCHESDGFMYVCQNNTTTAFTAATTSSAATNQYVSDASHSIGEIGCYTCHSSLHTTYTSGDTRPFTTTAAVAMTMWAGAITINLAQDNGISNLCVKCHQPRPFTKSNLDVTTGHKGEVLDYAALVSNPTGIFYDSTAGVTTNVLKPGYRTHTHYGTVGAVYAGKGGIEFAGAEPYANSPHTTLASCQDCHMAPVTGRAGGHTFVAKGNFNGCNITGCHSASPISLYSAKFTTPRANQKLLLEQLAAKLKEGGIEIMNKNPDATTNLWYGHTTGNYDGYLNVYDPLNNPSGQVNNTSGTFQNASPSSFWTVAQRAQNLTYPKLILTNAQMGAIINFQFCLREYSLGIHNTTYTHALLVNTIAKL